MTEVVPAERARADAALAAALRAASASAAPVDACAEAARASRRPLIDVLVERGVASPRQLAELVGPTAPTCAACRVVLPTNGLPPVCPACRQPLRPIADGQALVLGVLEALSADPDETLAARRAPTGATRRELSPPPGLAGPAPVEAGDHAPVVERGRIGRYSLRGELGRGGMGVVHRGWDEELQRDVAIKMILGGRAGEKQRERFVREARATAKLRHPAIVAVHEVGEHGGSPYLVMDFIDGETLEAANERDRLGPARVAKVIREVAFALDHAHGQGIIHRDVKPQNVILDGRGDPHLVDFGLARETDAEGGLTLTGQLIGTPSYLSPEQARGEHDRLGPASDVFALGSVLYWGLVGAPPFEGESVLEVVRRVIVEDPVAPRSLEPTVHPDLETICLRCLEKEPARRYPSAAAVGEDLRRFLSGEAILARPLGRIGRARRWAGRSPLRAALLGALGLLVVAAGAAAAAGLYEVRRRVAEQREAVFTEARREAARTWTDLVEARGRAAVAAAGAAATAPVGDPDGADALIALGLEAMRTADAVFVLDRLDATARRRAYEAAMACGEIASSAERWSLAESAFRRARALGVDESAAREALGVVAAERRRAADGPREAVAAILDEARAGQLTRAGAHRDALFALVRHPTPTTVALLAEELDAIAEELRAVTRATFLATERPSGAELAGGQTRIVGLAAAVDRWLALPPGELPDRELERTLTDARERMSARAARGAHVAGPTALPAPDEIIAAQQERELGHARLALARLCCDALAGIGIREGAVDAIAGYLWSERDEGRALDAAIALCTLGGPDASRIVLGSEWYFDANGNYWRHLRPYLRRLDPPELTSETSQGYEERAMRRYALGDIEGAKADLDAAIRLRPDSPALYARRALVDPDALETVGFLTKAIALDVENAAFLGNRGSNRIALGDPFGGFLDASAAIAANPRLGFGYLVRANALWRLGALPAALGDLEHVIRLDGDEARAWLWTAWFRFHAGEPDEALAAIDQALVLAPKSPVAFSYRGALLARAGDAEGARSAMRRALELDPSDPVMWRESGELRLILGDVAGALAHAERARVLATADDDSEPWGEALMTRVLLARGDADAALATADAALRRWPYDVDIRHTRGRVLAALGRHEEARAEVVRAIRGRPGDPDLWTTLGDALVALGRIDEALAAHDRAIALDYRGDPAVINPRGEARVLAGDAAGAEADHTRAIEIAPFDAKGWRGRAAARAALGRLAEALEDADRACDLVPTDARARTVRAELRSRSGDPKGALADADELVRLAPERADSWRMRSRVRERSGDRAGALADLDRALMITPELGDDEEVRRRLETLGGEGSR